MDVQAYVEAEILRARVRELESRNRQLTEENEQLRQRLKEAKSSR